MPFSRQARRSPFAGWNSPFTRRRSPRRSSPSVALERLEDRTLLTMTPVGPEFVANTYTTDYQSMTDVASDADGNSRRMRKTGSKIWRIGWPKPSAVSCMRAVCAG